MCVRLSLSLFQVVNSDPFEQDIKCRFCDASIKCIDSASTFLRPVYSFSPSLREDGAHVNTVVENSRLTRQTPSLSIVTGGGGRDSRGEEGGPIRGHFSSDKVN